MNDVFISYAHIDDKPLTEGQKGWITQFHRALEVRLGQLLGEEARIWRDPKLQGGDLFDDKLVSQFLESKVLVSVVSPRYVRSEWCQREVQEFWKGAEEHGGLKVGDKSRIFKVVKTPVPPEVVPPILNELFSRLLGFEFYEVDAESGRIREYDESFGERAKQRYFERVYDLAQEISTVIRVIQAKEGGSLAADPGTAGGGGRTIYLAATTSDQLQNRDQLRRELGAKGHTILPDCPLPMVEGELRAVVREMLSRSDFAIHPIGGLYGIVPEGAEESVIAIQNALAAEASRHGLKRIIWLPTGTEIHDERQLALVTTLMEDSDAHLGAELIRDTIENLKDVVLTRLKPPEKKPAALADSVGGAAAGPAQGSQSEGAPLVYLICDPSDEEAIEPLEDYLFDQGFEVSHPDFEAEETEAAEQHRDMLRDCDAVIIYYGAARQAWVDIKLRGLAKAIGYGRRAPIAVQAVCIAPPDDRRKERFRTHNAEIIRMGDVFDAAAFASFVGAVKAAKPQSAA